jgi:thymidylate kinase
MRVVHITGISGAGKSACSRRLAALGYSAISTDGTEGLCRWVRRTDGAVVTDRPDEPSGEWLTAHDWAWDPVRFTQIVEHARSAGVDTLYLCGNAANDGDFAYDRIVLLDIDEATMLRRLDDPARGNDFGRVGESRALLRSWLSVAREKYLARGAVVVDATAPLDDVVAEILRVSRAEPTSAAP